MQPGGHGFTAWSIARWNVQGSGSTASASRAVADRSTVAVGVEEAEHEAVRAGGRVGAGGRQSRASSGSVVRKPVLARSITRIGSDVVLRIAATVLGSGDNPPDCRSATATIRSAPPSRPPRRRPRSSRPPRAAPSSPPGFSPHDHRGRRVFWPRPARAASDLARLWHFPAIPLPGSVCNPGPPRASHVSRVGGEKGNGDQRLVHLYWGGPGLPTGLRQERPGVAGTASERSPPTFAHSPYTLA